MNKKDTHTWEKYTLQMRLDPVIEIDSRKFLTEQEIIDAEWPSIMESSWYKCKICGIMDRNENSEKYTCNEYLMIKANE